MQTHSSVTKCYLMQVSLVVLTKKELLNLLSRLKLFYEARGTWEPEVMDKRPRMQRKWFL